MTCSSRLKELGAVDLEKDLLPSLGSEGAFALQPPPGEAAAKGGGKGAIPPSSQAPFLEFIAGDVDADRADKALARLEGPITQALNPSEQLQAPSFSEHKVGDVTAHSVAISPTRRPHLRDRRARRWWSPATPPVSTAVARRQGRSRRRTDLFGRATAGFPGDALDARLSEPRGPGRARRAAAGWPRTLPMRPSRPRSTSCRRSAWRSDRAPTSSPRTPAWPSEGAAPCAAHGRQPTRSRRLAAAAFATVAATV